LEIRPSLLGPDWQIRAVIGLVSPAGAKGANAESGVPTFWCGAMSLRKDESGKLLRGFVCFLISIILISGTAIAGQEEAEKKHRVFSDTDLLRETGYLLKLRLDEYAKLCEDETEGKHVRDKMIPLLENIIGLLKHIRNIYEAQGGNKQRLEKISHLVDVYEKKKLHYLKMP